MFTRIIQYFYNLLGSYLVGGPKGVLKHIYMQISRKKLIVKSENPFTFILNPNHGKIVATTKSSHKRKTLNWFVMDMGTHGGGDVNIFRYINGLHKLGFESNVYVSYFCKHSTREKLSSYIHKYYGDVKANFFLPNDPIKPADAAIATEWRTAYLVKKLTNVKDKFYFIQDYEPSFFPVGSEYELARRTYTFGFKGITAGYWLQDKIAREFGVKTLGYIFSYDPSVYEDDPAIQRRPNSVFFYSRPVTPRRAFDLGALALEELHKQLPNVEIVLAGWDEVPYELEFPYTNKGVLTVEELAETYNMSQLGLVLSLTNCSLLPTELLACGCLPIINGGENNEWLVKHLENGVVVDTDPVNIAKTMKHYLDNKEEREAIVSLGKQSIKASSYEEEFKKVAKFIKQYV